MAEICRINTFPDHLIDPDPVCCKEEIVYSNRSDGFSGGDTIEANLFDDCYKFLVNNEQENLNIQLRSFREKKVSQIFWDFVINRALQIYHCKTALVALY